MHAMVIDKYGEPEVFYAAELEPDAMGPEDLVIRIYATSVNPVDWKVRQGKLAPRLPSRFPAILGWDAAGIVVEVGSGVTQFNVGDPVFSRPAIHRPGTYAELTVVDQSLVARKPVNLTYLEAASIPLAGLTAWEALVEIGKIGAHHRVLVHGGGGGVGSYAVQLARAYGAEVIATASAARRDDVRKLGATQVIDYQRESFADMVHNVDLVFDTVGGSVQDQSYTVLKPGGTLVSIAKPPDPEVAKAHEVSAHWFFLEPDGKKLEALGRLFEQGKMRPAIGHVFPLGEIGAAHRLSQEGHPQGKIGIVVDADHAMTY